MENLGTAFKTAAALIGGVVAWLYGGELQFLKILILLVLADYFSGIAASALEGSISSRTGYVGAVKKLGIFIVIAMAHQLDIIFGNTDAIRDTTIFFYMANELISIVENAGRIGIPLPPVFSKVIAVLKEKGDKNNE